MKADGIPACPLPHHGYRLPRLVQADEIPAGKYGEGVPIVVSHRPPKELQRHASLTLLLLVILVLALMLTFELLPFSSLS